MLSCFGRTKLLAVLVTFCVFASFAEDVSGNDHAEAEKALQAAMDNDRKVDGVARAFFEQSCILSREKAGLEDLRTELEFGWDGERTFMHYKENEKVDERRVFDGMRAFSLSETPMGSDVAILDTPHMALHGLPEWHLNHMFPLRNHRWGSEAEGAVPLKFEYLETRPVGGIRCFVFGGIGRTFEYRPLAVRVWLDESGRLVQKEEYVGAFGPRTPIDTAFDAANLRTRISYRDYQRHGEIEVPMVLDLKGFSAWALPDRTIKTTQVDFDARLPEDMFAFAVPPSTPVCDMRGEWPYDTFPSPSEQTLTSELTLPAQGLSEEQEQEFALARAMKEKTRSLLGKPAPEIVATKWFSGKPLSLAKLRGRWIVLDFTSIYCGPCKAAIGFLNEGVCRVQRKTNICTGDTFEYFRNELRGN